MKANGCVRRLFRELRTWDHLRDAKGHYALQRYVSMELGVAVVSERPLVTVYDADLPAAHDTAMWVHERHRIALNIRARTRYSAAMMDVVS